MKCLLLLCLCLSFSAMAQPGVALQRLVNTRGLESAAIGVSVKRVSDGKAVVEYNSGMALHPASLTKLITTAFVLNRKGGAYRYTTRVGYTGEVKNGILEGNIRIHPGGDPSPDSKYFPDYKLTERLLVETERLGIKEIKGTIVVEGEERESLPGSWPWEDISNYYAAPYHLFNYRDNTYTLELKSGKAGTPVELLAVKPEQPGIRFRNELLAAATNRDDAWIFGGPYSQVMCLKGTIPSNRTLFIIKGAIHHPATCFVNEFSDRLRQRGITTGNIPVKTGTEKEWFTLYSPPLEELVCHTNKSSVNLFAEALGRLACSGGSGAEQFLQTSGINTSGVILKDACGLSHLNAVPAVVFTDLLIWAEKNVGPSFVNSLPVAGTDNGLNNYTSPLLKGNMKAKTGSFSGVRCLSGYLKTSTGELLAFTILVNNYSCPSVVLYSAIRTFLSDISDPK